MTQYPVFPFVTPVGSSGSGGGGGGGGGTDAAEVAAFKAADQDTYYIDAVAGSDADLTLGKSPLTPFASAAALLSASPAVPAGSILRFKAGQRHPMAGFTGLPASNCTIDRYDAGAAPWLWRGIDAGPLGENVTWTDLADGTGRWTATVFAENASNNTATRCGFGTGLTAPLPRAFNAADVGRNIKAGPWTRVGGVDVWSTPISGLTSPGFIDLLSVNGAAPTNSEEYQSMVLINHSWMYKSTNATSGTIYLYSTVDPSTLTSVQAGAGWHITTGVAGVATMTIFAPHGDPKTVYATGIVRSATATNDCISLTSTKTGTRIQNVDLCYGNSGLDVSATDVFIFNVAMYGHFSHGCTVYDAGPGITADSCSFRRNGILAAQGGHGLKIGKGQEKITSSQIINCTFDENGEDGFTEQCSSGSYFYHVGCLSKRNNENAIDVKQKGTHRLENCTYISRNWLQGGAGVGAAAFQADNIVNASDTRFITVTNGPGVQTNPRTNGRMDRCVLFTARGAALGLGANPGTSGAFDGYWQFNACQFICSDRDVQGTSLMLSAIFNSSNGDFNQCTFSQRGFTAGDLNVQLNPNTGVTAMLCRINNCILHSESGNGSTSQVMSRSATSAQSLIKLQARNNILWAPNLNTGQNWVQAQATSGVQLTDVMVDAGVDSVLNFDGGTTIHTVGKTLTGVTSNAQGVITNFVTAGSSPNRAGTLYLKKINNIPFLDNETVNDNNSTPGTSIVNGLENDSFICSNTIADPTVNPLFTNPWKGYTNAEEEETGDFSIGVATPGIGAVGTVWIIPYDNQTANYFQGEKVLFVRSGSVVATAWIRNDYDTGATGVLCVSGLSAAVADNDTIQGTISGGVALVNDPGVAVVSAARMLVNLGWATQSVAMTPGLLVTGGTSTHKGYLISQTASGGTGKMALACIPGQTFQNAETLTDTGGGSRTASGTATASPAKRAYTQTNPPVIAGIDLAPLDYVTITGNASGKHLSAKGNGTTLNLYDEGGRMISSGFQVGDTVQPFDIDVAVNGKTYTVTAVTANALSAASADSPATSTFTADITGTALSNAVGNPTANVGCIISGTGVPANTFLTSFNNAAHTGVLSQAATNGTGVTLTVVAANSTASILKTGPVSAGAQAAA